MKNNKNEVFASFDGQAVAVKQNKFKRLFKSIYAAGASAAALASVTAAQASAFGDDVTVSTTQGGDAGTLMGKIIGILLTITRFVGVALVIYGIYEVVMSFMQNQPEAKTKGIIMALAGVVMIGLKSIITSLGIIS